MKKLETHSVYTQKTWRKTSLTVLSLQVRAAWGHLASWGFCSRTGDRDWNVLPWRYSQPKVPLFCWDSQQFLVLFLCVFGCHTEKHQVKLKFPKKEVDELLRFRKSRIQAQDSSKEDLFLLYKQWQMRQWGDILGKQYSEVNNQLSEKVGFCLLE